MKNGKLLLSGLLITACIISGILLAIIPASNTHKFESLDQIDNLIEESFSELGIPENQFRTSNIQVDSTFSRKIYRTEVSKQFSKTSFHLNLHHKLFDLQAETYARVSFPEEDMRIHVYVNNTVQRSIFLNTSHTSTD